MATTPDDVRAAKVAQIAASTESAAAIAKETAALEAAKTAAVQQASAIAQLKSQLDAAKAAAQGMAAMSAILDAKHKADAQSALDAAKAEKALAEARLASARAMKASAAPVAKAKSDDAAKAAEKAARDQAKAARETAAEQHAAWAQQDADMSAWKGAATQAFGIAKDAAIAFAAAVLAATAVVVALGTAIINVVQQRAQMLATFGALAGGAAGGAAVLAMVDSLALKLPFTTEQLGTWAKSLQSAGFEGAKLKSAIEAVAAATALMGEQGGAAAQKMLKQLEEGGQAASKMIKTVQEGGKKAATLLADMGLQTKDLAAALGVSEAQFKSMHLSAEQLQKAIEKALATKGAGPLAAMALSLPVLAAKLKEGLLGLFEKLGPAVKPFMKAIQDLFGQFGKGAGPMKALQKVVTEVFGELFKYATMAVKAISAFVKENFTAKNVGSVWKDIKGAIAAVLPIAKAFIAPLRDIFKNAETLKGLKVIFLGIAAVIGIAILATLACVAAIATFVGYIGNAVGKAAGFVGAIKGFVTGGLGALKGLITGAGGAASGFISGLLNGIKAGAGAIIAAVAGLAKGALGAFKSALGIASPSKVMMEQGGHMATGVAEGVTAGAPKAQAATAAMVNPDALKTGKGGGAKGGAGKSVVFQDCTFGSVSKSQITEWVLEAMDADATGGPEAMPA